MQAITLGIVVIERPRTASISLLIIYTGLFVEHLVILSQIRFPLIARDSLLVLATVTAFWNILVILNMPMRDPSLPVDGISQVFTMPTAKFRTPEDNLTPWQYMSVSWMQPLISKGRTRKLEDEDVWDLGYEFKHQRLYSAFRTLQGSVTRRLLIANGMDLVRTTLLALLQLAASKTTIRTRSSHINQIVPFVATTDTLSTRYSRYFETTTRLNARSRVTQKCYNNLRLYLITFSFDFRPMSSI